MGLYDGAAGQGELASTAHVAKLLRAPGGAGGGRLVAVAFGGGAGARLRVLGPGGAGRGRDPQQGRLGPARGAAARGAGRLGRAGARARCGACRELGTPSRHLGLVPGRRTARRGRRVGRRRWPSTCAQGCDLDALLALARTAPPLAASVALGRPRPRSRQPGRSGRGGTAAWSPSAGGAAFTFSYAEHAELLRAAGAEVVPFDPLRDEELPTGTRGAGHRRRLPRGVRAGAVGERAAARGRDAARLRRRRPWPPSAPDCCIWHGSWTGRPMCGVLDARRG